MIDFRKLSLREHLLIAEQLAISASEIFQKWGKNRIDAMQLKAALAITEIIRHQLNNVQGDDTLYDMVHDFQTDGIKAIRQARNLPPETEMSVGSVELERLPNPSAAYAGLVFLSIYAAGDTIGWALDYENGDIEAVHLATKNSSSDLSDAVRDLACARSINIDSLCQELRNLTGIKD